MGQSSGGFYAGSQVNGSTLAAAFRTKLDVSALDDFVAASSGLPGPQGPAGPQGPVGAIGLGVLVPWKAGTVYSPGPLPSYVNYNGSSYVCYAQHTAGIFANDLAFGFWGIVAQAGAAGPPGPASTPEQILVAAQALLGVPTGIAQLDTTGRQPLAQDAIRAWQVIRAARPVLVNAGGTWSDFLASEVGGPDATDGSYEAVQAGAPAPVGGILSGLISAYLTGSLSMTQSQAASALVTIWQNAVGVTP